MFVMMTGATLLLGWTFFDPPGTYEFNSVPTRANSQRKRFEFSWSYMDGSVVNERLGLDRVIVCSRCILAFASFKIRGTSHRLAVVIAHDRLILPVWFLVAFASWKIGQAIAARHWGQSFRNGWNDGFKRRVRPYSRYLLPMFLAIAACWVGYTLNWARQRHIARCKRHPYPCDRGTPSSHRGLCAGSVNSELARSLSKKEATSRLRDLFPESRVVSGSEFRP